LPDVPGPGSGDDAVAALHFSWARCCWRRRFSASRSRASCRRCSSCARRSSCR